MRVDFALIELPDNGLDVLGAGRIAEVNHEQRAICRLQGVHDPAFDVVTGNRWHVHELEQHVLEGQHARQWQLGSKGVGADVCPGARQPRVQLGLAGVGSAKQRNLGGALRSNGVDRTLFLPALAAGTDLVGDFLDPALDVTLEVVRALVLRNGPKHFLQVLELLRGLAGFAIGLFGLPVDGSEIRGHEPVL